MYLTFFFHIIFKFLNTLFNTEFTFNPFIKIVEYFYIQRRKLYNIFVIKFAIIDISKLTDLPTKMNA